MSLAGIDVRISRLMSALTAKLWTGKTGVNYFGRAYLNVRDGGIIPEVYDSVKATYVEVLQDNSQSANVFVEVKNPVEFSGGKAEARCWFMFAVNLQKLYTSETGRADEHAHRDAVIALERLGVQINRIVSGFDAFSHYRLTQQNKDDMQPLHLFRIEGKMIFNYQNC